MLTHYPNIRSVWFLNGNRPEKQEPRKRSKNETFPVCMSDDFLRQGNFAWLPIEGTGFRIVFNESDDSISDIISRFGFGICLWAFEDDDPHDIDYLPIPTDALVKAYDTFNNRINDIRTSNPKYDAEHDRFLSELLAQGKTGKHYFLYRTLLYGGLFRNQ